MEEKTARIRINVSAGEIEVEGTETFVREYAEKFEILLKSLKEPPPQVAPVRMTLPEQELVPTKTDMPAVFGEYLQQFPKSTTDIDRVLIAAYFVQSQDPDTCFFTTRNANNLLTEQGFKVANASDCVKKSIKTKRVFVVDKAKRKCKYRVSQPGIDYINGLMEETG